jgi:excisionase family DNA binding protein|tara:strand:+ start:1982 stop:2167 length:186 start_codon:yes stop_codon:yes gene_type:complete
MKDQITEEPIFITKKEVAELLRIKSTTVSRYITKGYLKPLGFDGRVLFNRQDLIDSISNSK